MDNNNDQITQTVAATTTDKKPLMKKVSEGLATHTPRVIDAAIGTAIVVGATVAIKAIAATVASNAAETSV